MKAINKKTVKMKKLKYYIPFIIISLLIIFNSSGCSEEPPVVPPPPDLRKISLSIEDVSCIEVWLRITTNRISLPVTISLLQDSITNDIILSNQDTLLYIDSLIPNTYYTYRAILAEDTTLKSEQETAKTLDTTSHNFTWQTFEFGQHSSSVLFDVAIIDESNIWAVGEIYMDDSLGQPDPHAYNAVHWDGTQWQLKRIYFPTVCSSSNLTPYPAKAIFAFSDGEIWISSSGDKIAILKDGNQINQFCLPSNVSMSINKIWGTSSEDLYIVGNNGNIAWYNGTSWSKIESGTELNFWGISGFNYSNQVEVFCVANNYPFGPEKKILQIIQGEAYEVNSSFFEDLPYTVWCKDNKKIYISGHHTYESTLPLTGNWKEISVGFFAIKSISGDNYNNIIGCGTLGVKIHFNGYTWKDITYISGQVNGVLYGSSIKNNTSVVVGFNGSKAIITLLKQL